jgi:hypothetical protein
MTGEIEAARQRRTRKSNPSAGKNVIRWLRKRYNRIGRFASSRECTLSDVCELVPGTGTVNGYACMLVLTGYKGNEVTFAYLDTSGIRKEMAISAGDLDKILEQEAELELDLITENSTAILAIASPTFQSAVANVIVTAAVGKAADIALPSDTKAGAIVSPRSSMVLWNRRDLVSDADREQTVNALAVAFSEGRLTRDELDARLALAWKARKYSDIEKVLDGLSAQLDILMSERQSGNRES